MILFHFRIARFRIAGSKSSKGSGSSSSSSSEENDAIIEEPMIKIRASVTTTSVTETDSKKKGSDSEHTYDIISVRDMNREMDLSMETAIEKGKNNN